MGARHLGPSELLSLPHAVAAGDNRAAVQGVAKIMFPNSPNPKTPALRRRITRKISRILKRSLGPIERRFGVITHVDTEVPAVALTFDDGPHPQWTPRLLDLLARHRAKATFFMVGEMAARYPDLVASVAAAGHAIGNHSWNHPSFPAVPSLERSAQVARCASVIPVGPRKLFRPPFGDLDWKAYPPLIAKGYAVIAWSVSSSDWRRGEASQIVDAVERQLRPGSIVLMHDHLFAYSTADETSRETMLLALERLMARTPFGFVTVPELLLMGRPQRRFWLKETERDWLRGLDSYCDLGFRY